MAQLLLNACCSIETKKIRSLVLLGDLLEFSMIDCLTGSHGCDEERDLDRSRDACAAGARPRQAEIVRG